MSESLPERPDLDQLRRRAKELRDAARSGDPAALQRLSRHLAAAPDNVTLALSQLVVARELGFTSWPRLKAGVEARTSDDQPVAAFLAACLGGRRRHAADVINGDPHVASRDLRAAAVLGEAELVRRALTADPSVALVIDEERGWPPLLYACYSRWHDVDPERASGLAAVVGLLLDAGASPDTNDGGRLRYRSALRGSVEVNNPDVTRVLLERGAHPDPGEPVAEAAAHRDHRCLRLLIAHGARVERTWALGAAVFHDDAEAVSLLLDALEGAGAAVPDIATETLPEAAGTSSPSVVAALLEAGADPTTADGDNVSAFRLAVRAGKSDTAKLLQDRGAPDDATDVDRLLDACINADRQRADGLLADHPDLRGRMDDQDEAVIVACAPRGPAASVRLMLDLGFSPDTRRFGEVALHGAAYWGNAAVVRVLLDAGADIEARDDRFGGTPLGFATVGSGEQSDQPGDWVETVTMLIEAGASIDGVWVSGKPPSDEVADLLGRFGVGPGPDEPPDDEPDDEIDVPGSIGAGVMAAIAGHLEDAHHRRDLELLGSLLNPEVHWTGVCKDKDHVLDWYRRLLAEGTVAEVESVEVDGDGVILGLRVSLPAEGARPAAPQRVFQVFTVVDGQIVDLRGYPDRKSALARKR